jgi:hypothetical protein
MCAGVSSCLSQPTPSDPRWKSLFRDALNGVIPRFQDRSWLTRGDVERGCRSIPFPAWAVDPESKLRTLEWIDTRSGRAAVWRLAYSRRFGSKRGGGGGDEPLDGFDDAGGDGCDDAAAHAAERAAAYADDGVHDGQLSVDDFTAARK